jgi:hypothetical protein
MKPEGSLVCLQELTTGPSLEPDDAVHTLIPYLFKIHFIIILPCVYRFLKWSFSLGFQTKILYAFFISPVTATYPTHLILLVSMELVKTLNDGLMPHRKCLVNFKQDNIKDGCLMGCSTM